MIRKWLRLGASGWRLDVADELPDSFIAAIRMACKTEQKDALLLGEVWEDASHKISYDRLRKYLLGQELDCTMHYPLRDGAVAFLLGQKTAGAFAEEMESIRENYPETALYGALNLVGTHDTPRILTVLGEAPEGLTEAERENYRLPLDKRDMDCCLRSRACPACIMVTRRGWRAMPTRSTAVRSPGAGKTVTFNTMLECCRTCGRNIRC